jgi:large subunit ribosomal protein L24
MASRIKKGDRVAVLSGRDKGKQGEVLKVLRAADRVLVQGINIVKRHTRQSAKSAGGIIEQEAPIHVSNLAHLDPKDNKPTRVGFRLIDGGRKVRYAKRSGEIIDR